MSDPARPAPIHQPGAHARRGQTLVEFALLLPLLIVLFLGIVDFGRVFGDSIVLEASARNGAEAAAQEYVQLARNRPGGTLTAADYTRLHDLAIEIVCEEGEKLSTKVASGGSCSLPYTAVCVHDEIGGDGTNCGTEASGAPDACHLLKGPLAPGWDPHIEQSPNGTAPLLPYVEVRVCYRFVTIFNLTDLQLPLMQGLNLGEIWMQRDRVFVGGNW